MAQSAKKERESRNLPLPEVVDPSKSWVVREPGFMSSSGLDYKAAVMTVPTTRSPKDRIDRNRQMLKLKYSPKSPPRLPADVSPEVYAACEQNRTDYRGTRVGINHDAPTLSEAEIKTASDAWVEKPWIAASYLMANQHSGDWGSVYGKLRQQYEDGVLTREQYDGIMHAFYQASYYTSRGKAPGPKQAIKAAQAITSILVPPPPAPPEASGDGKTGPDGAEVANQVKKGNDKMKEQVAYKAGPDRIEKAIEDAEYRHGDKPGLVEFPDARWGEMEIFKPPRPLIFPARLKTKKWRPTDTGSVFRYPQRWLADQSGFAYRGMKQGGCTMLIDVSGSMHLEQSDILTIMTYMPASLIATYSGAGGHGKLTIVGEKGRRAEEHHFRTGGGGNVVDAPALRWLAKQKGPRYWISDGYVVGIGGHTAELYAECIHICRRHHIMRIDSMADVIEKFAEYGKRS